MTMEEVNDFSIARNSNNGDDDDFSDATTTDDNTHGIESMGHGGRRDEMGEVRKMSSKDTFRLRLWRIVVTGVLLLTALAVTMTTYTLLQQQEDANFHTAFEQLARTVGDAAVDQQQRMIQSMTAFGSLVSAAAQWENATWPMFRIPNYELHAGQVRLQGGFELIGCANFVVASVEDEYLKFVTSNYEVSVKEGHMIRYGNLDRLTPIGYTPEFKVISPEGLVPDTIDRESRWSDWPISPPFSTYHSIHWDIDHSLQDIADLIAALLTLKNESVISLVRPYVNIGSITEDEHNAMHSTRSNSDSSFPHSFLLTPIHESPIDSESKVVAFAYGGFSWDFALRYLLPNNVEGIVAEIRNSCNQTSSYELDGHDAFFLGQDASHEYKYEKMEVVRELSHFSHPNFKDTPGHCQYTIHIFPSTKFHNQYNTNTPLIYAGIVAFTFVLVALVFLIYDFLVQHRNERIVATAARSNAIVSSMFPDAIRDRLLQQPEASTKRNGSSGHLKSYLLNGDTDYAGNISSKPLADLFLETTIMFADICGFTAWSSVRDPTQVFSLLESLYNAFDAIASRRRVFKVETVGDCYVAVTGLPEPRKDHAVVMARFAREIMIKMDKLARVLELTLGPGTGELKLRIGIHSGPVTGGVLRGERSRFQLFGDTMNTTARIESTGERGRIHISTESAELLKQAGKLSWLKQRDSCITAKGKGSMQTYWLSVGDNRDEHTISAGSEGKQQSLSSDLDELDNSEYGDDDGIVSQQTTRLIKWNVEQLLGLLKQVVARRSMSKSLLLSSTKHVNFPSNNIETSPIDDVQEIITLPEFDSTTYNDQIVDDVEIPQNVVSQLKAYVTWVASMYRSNPFHNFDHASHVVMSVIKLMARIVAPTDQHINDNAETLHDHTYGITSDPLTQFACVFSALIHDVDHTGVPNTTLVSEHTDLAAKYNDRSVAEQNSLDLAWNFLMNEAQYCDLRSILFTSQAELIRFRKLVVNGVMATDIADKDLKTLRNNRWDKAFKVDTAHAVSSIQGNKDAVNRKATIVIEHLIQASDVSHTMQHWHVFRKWNQLLFEEMYEAYVAGRAEKNPVDFWYQGEIGFFDYYIIPLAKKLKDCGVFGVSSDEYLNYAMKNHAEWEARGQEVVMEMVESVVNGRTSAKIEPLKTIEEATKQEIDAETFDGSSVEC